MKPFASFLLIVCGLLLLFPPFYDWLGGLTEEPYIPIIFGLFALVVGPILLTHKD